VNYAQSKKMAQHESLALSTGMRIFFADPHSPWQRGSNENTNGLLHQYFPKGTVDLERRSTSRHQASDSVDYWTNRRRKRMVGLGARYET
jgi:IS30 family transposase